MSDNANLLDIQKSEKARRLGEYCLAESAATDEADLMTKAVAAPDPNTNTIARMPSWVTLAGAETLADVVFLSGAALSHLHVVAASEDLPHALWRARLALGAAEACAAIAGRRERAAELRDCCISPDPVTSPGAAGEIFRQWARVVARPIFVAALGKALPGLPADRIAFRFDAARSGNPVDRAAGVLEAVLTDTPRAETAALILAEAALILTEAALARALGGAMWCRSWRRG